jgi:hypothetical protein
VRRIWSDAVPHAILGGVFSFGQFAIGGLAVTFLLTPVLGLPHAAGSIIEMSFAGQARHQVLEGVERRTGSSPRAAGRLTTKPRLPTRVMQQGADTR